MKCADRGQYILSNTPLIRSRFAVYRSRDRSSINEQRLVSPTRGSETSNDVRFTQDTLSRRRFYFVFSEPRVFRLLKEDRTALVPVCRREPQVSFISSGA
jgi:hypothetical protein